MSREDLLWRIIRERLQTGGYLPVRKHDDYVDDERRRPAGRAHRGRPYLKRGGRCEGEVRSGIKKL